MWFTQEPKLAPRCTASGQPKEHRRGTLRRWEWRSSREFALPFEIASLILLAAIIGAVVIAKKKVSSRDNAGGSSSRT